MNTEPRLKGCETGPDDEQNPHKADEERHPATWPHRFAQHHHRQSGDHQRPRKLDRGDFGERQRRQSHKIRGVGEKIAQTADILEPGPRRGLQPPSPFKAEKEQSEGQGGQTAKHDDF